MPDQSAEKTSVLVVDDDPTIGDALKLVLEENGYEVIVVNNGREGIKRAGIRRFRVAIIDLNLPDMSGLQVMKTLHEECPELISILITGQGDPRAFSEARRLGAVGILAKPFRPVDILEMITRAMAR